MLNLLPRAGVPYGKSGRIDYPDSYARKMLIWREEAKTEALYSLESCREYSEIQKYIDWIEGSQWDPGRPAWRSKFYDNRMAQARREALSSLTRIRPALDISSLIRKESYEKQASIVDKCIRSAWLVKRVGRTLIKVVDHALFGSAFFKTGAALPGELFITAHGMDQVLPIQMGDDIQQSAGVLYRTYKNLQYFRNTFGERAEGLEKQSVNHLWAVTNNRYQKPAEVTEYTWNVMSPAMRYHMAGRTKTVGAATRSDVPAFPILELQEYWIDDPSINEGHEEMLIKHPDLDVDEHNYHYLVPPGRRLFPRKRLICFGGDRVCYDGPSPYWHGLYPFPMLQLNPCVWSPGGISKYRDILPLAQALNEIGAGTLDAIKKALRPQMLTKRGAVDGAAWKAFFADLPGAKLQMTPIADVSRDVRYMDAPVLPSYVPAFAQYLLSTLREYEGSLDMTGLKSKKQAPGADTVETMRDAMSAPFQLEASYIEDFLCDTAIQCVSNVFQYYTVYQRLRLLGSDGWTMEDFDYWPNYMIPFAAPKESYWKTFPVSIAQGSLLGSSQDRKKVIGLTLRKQRDISRRELLRVIDWPGNAAQIEEELKQEAAEGIPGGASGRTPRMTRGQRTGNPI